MTRPRPSSRNKFVLSFGVIIASVVYAAWQNTISSSLLHATTTPAMTPSQSYQVAQDALQQTLAHLAVPTPSTPSAPQTQPTPVTTAPKPAPTPTPVPQPQKPVGQYADGSYTGDAIDAYYGTVQIKTIVQGGKIADVQFLQYPNTHSNSRFINSQAMPLLTQEAIQAQNAQVSGVSGATFTSDAFRQSLASALTRAKV